ncbi:toxin-activating lysine-acyltransferase [Erwinia mallotivora]|uniref:toxin-activating lysine-acyltransferase n=1 Tax=Erwinia mallotivora TaxID=69222 RepID=UPI0035ED084D
MWLDEAAGRRYLSEPAIMQENDRASGERLWIRDWIAPFGDSLARSRLVGQPLSGPLFPFAVPQRRAAGPVDDEFQKQPAEVCTGQGMAGNASRCCAGQ